MSLLSVFVLSCGHLNFAIALHEMVYKQLGLTTSNVANNHIVYNMHKINVLFWCVASKWFFSHRSSFAESETGVGTSWTFQKS